MNYKSYAYRWDTLTYIYEDGNPLTNAEIVDRLLEGEKSGINYKRLVEDITELAGTTCEHCEYDEAKGLLYRHCDDCQESIVSDLWLLASNHNQAALAATELEDRDDD